MRGDCEELSQLCKRSLQRPTHCLSHGETQSPQCPRAKVSGVFLNQPCVLHKTKQTNSYFGFGLVFSYTLQLFPSRLSVPIINFGDLLPWPSYIRHHCCNIPDEMPSPGVTSESFQCFQSLAALCSRIIYGWLLISDFHVREFWFRLIFFFF